MTATLPSMITTAGGTFVACPASPASTMMSIAVVGASLGGLSAANVLHRLGHQVTVFEVFPSGFQERGGALGNVDVDLLSEIRGGGGPDGRLQVRGHGHFYGDLWSFLYDGLPEGTVKFGSEVLGVRHAPPGDTRNKPELLVADDAYKFDLIVGADGGKSVVRQYVTDQVPEYAGYTLWRGLCPTEGVEGPPRVICSAMTSHDLVTRKY